jgi:endonuclease III
VNLATPRRAGGPDRSSLAQVSHILEKTYGNPRHHNKDNPLDELVFILLSAKTTERSYLRTYEALHSRFPNWFAALDEPPGAIARVIVGGGLSKKKEEQLRKLLHQLRDVHRGKGLSILRRMSTPKAEDFLTSLPGVGLKSARCVLMYSLGRTVFPVDTHCRRVLHRLGLIEFRRLTDRVQNEIQVAVPSSLRYRLHVNLVAHGRARCTPQRPKCSDCPIRAWCRYYSYNVRTKPALIVSSPTSA